jgi:tRNA pseudouridine38/39 synthase
MHYCSTPDANQSIIEHLKDEYHHYMLQAAIFHEALSCLPGMYIKLF